ncbi:WD regulatory protein, putative [Ichthyophthirius multifiliis]|uniref:WD regulatory protein, putative n=1 Tax=Ichthyophthirius multifiliis TaxID=5932 RepID=G0QLY6_ICHMU|nr:WD regulatory protein, putative [Ichthyophthirius multifiliis]EGR33768.1 WD regulatory protein, putative [Ichthyophthirius multifiliis]|eukprot:XP_004038992.1 WD regulatory protein, putative [Ichthyophthirius multifiliis]
MEWIYKLSITSYSIHYNQNLVQGLQWNESGDFLSIGDSLGKIQIFDVNNSSEILSFRNHNDRIGSVAWKDDNIIATGSRDKQIICTDIRSRFPFQTFKGHQQEICGLKWSFDNQMLASGGNDNKLFVWSLKSHNYLYKFNQHKAAVKAIAWNPHQHGVLVSGGGTMDKSIRFWNTQIGKQVDQIETNSQVCNLVFSKNQNEFVSTHGFQDNEIIVWKYPTLQKIACLTGHSCRVLQLGLSPCSTKIVTGAGDQTLRFWDIFQEKNQVQQNFKQYQSVLDSKFDLR